MLTRRQMEEVIRGGGSVLHGGRLCTRIEQLPTDADLAKGNPAQEALAAQALEAQIAALQAQHDRLTQSRMPMSGQAGEEAPRRTESDPRPAQPEPETEPESESKSESDKPHAGSRTRRS